MVYMTLHCENLNFQLLALLPSELFEAIFYSWYKKYLSTIPWTEYEVIIDERDRRSGPEILVFHGSHYIISVYKNLCFVHKI